MESSSDESRPSPESPGPSPWRRFVVGPIAMAAYGLAMAAIPLLSCGASDTAPRCDAVCDNGMLWAVIPAGATFVVGLITTTREQYRSYVALIALTGLLPWLVLAAC